MVRHPKLARKTLVAALVAWADETSRRCARRFLEGLSWDELQYLSGFLGACIVESPDDGTRAVNAVHGHESRVAQAQTGLSDLDHKLILMREFLCRSGRQLPDWSPERQSARA